MILVPPKILERYDGQAAFQKYQDSAYTRGDKSPVLLSDSELYALKGYLFIEKKLDMIKFEPGHPPLGSYLMGLSNKFLGNPLYANLLVGTTFTLLLFTLVNSFLSSIPSAFITLAFVSSPLILSQFKDTLLDIYQLTFALGAISLYRSQRHLPLMQLLVGLMLATKFFLGGIILPVALTLSTVSIGDFKLFKRYIFSLIFLPAGFVLGHLSFFTSGHNLIEFARYQRYILNWWAGSPQTPPFQVWDLILFDRWHTWWDKFEIVAVPEWSPLWGMLIIGGLLGIVLTKKISGKERPFFIACYLWLFLGSFQLSFTAAFPRHLIFILLPGLLTLLIVYKSVTPPSPS